MTYTIKQGRHYSCWWPTLVRGQTARKYEVVFSQQCWYVDQDPERDWNKLIGFSEGLLPRQVNDKWVSAHHYNSKRFGWRPAVEEGMIELALYVYDKGVRRIIAMHSVPVEQPTTLYLYASFRQNPGWGWLLKPYHGGQATAPHTYQITIHEL